MGNCENKRSASGRARLTDRGIDEGFREAADGLGGYPSREVTLPPAGPGEDALELGYNGNMYVVRRGEAVALPEPVALILEQAGAL